MYICHILYRNIFDIKGGRNNIPSREKKIRSHKSCIGNLCTLSKEYIIIMPIMLYSVYNII